MISREQKRKTRHNRVRAKIAGTSLRPRLSIFKSNKDIYLQIIDDTQGKTLVSANSLKMSKKSMSQKAQEVGTTIAQKAKDAKISKIVFDRSGYQYTGLIKILADSARAGGLEF